MDERDIARLADRVRDALVTVAPGAGTATLTRLSGGASGLTLLAEIRSGVPCDRAVVKTIPAGLTATKHRDIVRQARVIRALGGHTSVPVASLLAVDAGDPPETPPFLVTEFVEGESYDPTADRAGDDTPAPAVVAERWLDAARVLARLHRSRPDELGLGAEPTTSLAAEVGRWRRSFETVAMPSGAAVECANTLVVAMPSPVTSVVVHGDYRLGNLLCAGDTVRAVIDWELWSVGDPRTDLAWLATRADPTHPSSPSSRGVPFASALPGIDAVIGAYVTGGGSEVADLGWFFALAAFKQAAAAALIDKRTATGPRRGPAHVPALVDWALARLAPR